MLPQEARWIGSRLEGEVVLNIGSSTASFEKRQPWIREHVLEPARARGARIINVDRKAAPGVDLVGDVSVAECRTQMRACGAHTLLCSNLLEHVEDPPTLARDLVDLVPDGGRLVITVPRSYPYHPDPMDNGLRPDVAELAGLFPGTTLVEGEEVSSGTYWDWLGHSPFRLVAAGLRVFTPFWMPRWWLADLSKFRWLSRPFSATCVVLRRDSAG